MNAPKITAIGSGKGGTGKTLVATALASALAHCGERLLLCDADLGLANATVHLGLDYGGDLEGLLAERIGLAAAVAQAEGGAGRRGGFDILAAQAGSGALANLDPTIAAKLIAKLRGARNYDRVLLDLSAGVDATTMEFVSRADDAILVLTADPASLTDAYAFVKLLLRMGGPKPRALVNIAESEADAGRTAESLIRTCRTFLKSAPDYLGSIPRDAHASLAIRQQRPLVALFPQSPSSRAFERIARLLNKESTDRHAGEMSLR